MAGEQQVTVALTMDEMSRLVERVVRMTETVAMVAVGAVARTTASALRLAVGVRAHHQTANPTRQQSGSTMIPACQPRTSRCSAGPSLSAVSRKLFPVWSVLPSRWREKLEC